MSAISKHEYAIYHPHTRSSTYVSATDLADAKNAGADILGVPRHEVEGRRVMLPPSIDGDVAEMRRVPVVSIGQGTSRVEYHEDIEERKDADAGSAALVCYVMAACVFIAGMAVGIVLAVWGGAR